MEQNDVWHYILPFPFESEKRQLIWKVLQSKIGKSLLMNIKLEGRTYQKDLISKTSYSNKSIIKYNKINTKLFFRPYYLAVSFINISISSYLFQKNLLICYLTILS